MKTIHRLFFLFFCALLFSCTPTLNAKVEIISLGSACTIARAARLNNLRDTAYPFDWLISPFDALKAGFEDDFAQLLIPEQTREREDGKAVIDGYGFVYTHDFPTIKHTETPEDGEIMPVNKLLPTWKDSIEIVKAKFARRLTRLYLAELRHAYSPCSLWRY